VSAGSACLRTAVVAMCAAATVLFVGGCAIQPDSAPRDIPDDLREPETPSATGAGGAAGGSNRIYLLARDGAEQPLRTVQRNTDNDAQTLIAELISGPNPGELDAGLSTAIPSTLELHSVRVDDGVVEVEVSDALFDLSGSELTQAVAQLVFTASEIPGAESVLIRVDGATQEWPDGSGAQHRGPLTTYDFIGWAESAQPAFPVSPTPTTAVPPSTTTTTIAATTTAAATTTTAPPAAPTTAAAPTTTAPT
jgi:Sporulation and spore germination